MRTIARLLLRFFLRRFCGLLAATVEDCDDCGYFIIANGSTIVVNCQCQND